MFYSYLSRQWHRIPEEVWKPLLELHLYPSIEQEEIPDDLIIEIVRKIYDEEKAKQLMRLRSELEEAENTAGKYFAAFQIEDDNYLELKARINVLKNSIVSLYDDEVLSDPIASLEYLKSFHKLEGISEDKCLLLVKHWHGVIEEYSSDLANTYVEILSSFFEHNNIRYLVRKNSKEEIRISLNPAVVAMERIQTVKQDICNEKPLSDLYTHFELNYGELLDECNPTRIRNVLSSSSNLLEAVANHAAGKTRGTLGNLVEDKRFGGTFPHKRTKDLIKNLYGFFSDYSGARHGSMNSGIRELEERDATTFGLISVSFADFISQPNMVPGLKVKQGVLSSVISRFRAIK